MLILRSLLKIIHDRAHYIIVRLRACRLRKCDKCLSDLFFFERSANDEGFCCGSLTGHNVVVQAVFKTQSGRREEVLSGAMGTFLFLHGIKRQCVVLSLPRDCGCAEGVQCSTPLHVLPSRDVWCSYWQRSRAHRDSTEGGVGKAAKPVQKGCQSKRRNGKGKLRHF